MGSVESITILLAGRAAMYRVLQNLFGNEPSDAMLEQLTSSDTKVVFELFAPEADGFEVALTKLSAAALSAPDAEVIEHLRDDFMHLFVGPGAMEAAPWESLYSGREQALFQPSTLEVRKAFVAQGFIPQSYPAVADDHLALELDFMARLAERAETEFERGGGERTNELLAASEEFLQQHLLVWVPRFVEALHCAPHGSFYKEVGTALEMFLDLDLQAIGEIRASI
jgi:TorA maturation chaperone TorD